jgi:hypothetical protein
MERIFITGASSGIGAALARHYAKSSATLGLMARRAPLLERLADELRGRGARVSIHVGDVTDTGCVHKSAERFVAEAGGADLVVANAGVGLARSTLKSDVDRVARLMAVNVIGVTNTILPFVPHMLQKNEGTLVAIGSVAGFRALPGRAAYCASKAAVMAFMDGLRMELHGSGVHAMTICPGFVHTEMTEDARHPLPFVLDAPEAARMIAGAIEARRNTYTFPWQMNALKSLLKYAPEPLVRAAIARQK